MDDSRGLSPQVPTILPVWHGRFDDCAISQIDGNKTLRPLLSILLLVIYLICACRPVLPPETLAVLAPDRLPITQSVASALKQDRATTGFSVLYPELRTAPAPRWLRPATRVTYRLTTASFAQTRDDPTPSGAGLLEYDIIGQNRQKIVFLSSLINTQIQGQPPTTLSYQVELPGSGEFWFSPQVLKNAESAASDVFQVARLPLVVEEVEYNAVRMQSNTITNQGSGEEVWAFDAATGLLVFYRQALYRHDGSQSSGTTLSLLGQRQLRLPWRNGTIPSWVEAGVAWQFAGNQVLDVGVGNPVPLPMASTTRITRVGALWSEHAQSISLYGRDAGSSITATGPMQIFGGFWLPPEAIAVLKAGTVLDQDPISGIQISVVEANRQRIVMASAGQGYVTQLYYHAGDGRLIGIYIEQKTPSGTLYTSLEDVQ